jgi:hypothetical protein
LKYYKPVVGAVKSQMDYHIPNAKSTVRKQSPTVVTTLDLNAVQMLGASNPLND